MSPTLLRPYQALMPALYDSNRCLAFLDKQNRNSWLIYAQLQSKDGVKFNILIQQIIMSWPLQAVKVASIINIYNVNKATNHTAEIVHEEREISLSNTRFQNYTPSSTFKGDIYNIHASADFNWISLDFMINFPGKILLNSGVGLFSFLGGAPCAQYTLPWGQGEGWLKIDDEYHEVTGTFCFDRQWGFPKDLFENAFISPNQLDQGIRININLDNDVILSVWDLLIDDKRNSWVTVMDEQGTHTIAELEPLSVSASDHWLSPNSHQYYPTQYVVRIAALDCQLHVQAVLSAQEIPSHIEPKYAGFAQVKGRYQGQPVTGFAFLELMGNWQQQQRKHYIPPIL